MLDQRRHSSILTSQAFAIVKCFDGFLLESLKIEVVLFFVHSVKFCLFLIDTEFETPSLRRESGGCQRLSLLHNSNKYTINSD